MKNITLLTILAIITTANIAHAKREPLIDPTFEKLELKVQEKEEKCREIDSVVKRYKCERTLEEVPSEEYRGEELYCEKYYLPLPTAELHEKVKLFRKQQKKARRYGIDYQSPTDRKAGEVSANKLAYEIAWIRNEIGRRNSLGGCLKDNKLFNQKTDCDEKFGR